MRRILGIFLLMTSLAAAQQPSAPDSRLQAALEPALKGNYSESIAALQHLMAEAPSEAVYFQLGNLYLHEKQLEKAAATFEDGATRYPLSARLQGLTARSYEQLMQPGKAIQYYRRTVALDPDLPDRIGGRYDAELDAIYLPAVHPHHGGVNQCAGRVYVTESQLHYVVYIVASGWGPGNDDSFQLPFGDIKTLQVERLHGSQDYALVPLLTNLSGPRRRIATTEVSGVSVKFVPKGEIHGYRGNPWSKNDVKLVFVEPETAERFLKFLESKGVGRPAE